MSRKYHYARMYLHEESIVSAQQQQRLTTQTIARVTSGLSAAGHYLHPHVWTACCERADVAEGHG